VVTGKVAESIYIVAFLLIGHHVYDKAVKAGISGAWSEMGRRLA
jgi:hypothetical protein